MVSVAVLGSFNMDLAVAAPVLPGPGRTVLGRSFFQGPGGKGSNQAVGARRLGAETAFLGAVGDDEYGRAARALLQREGIDDSGLAVVDEPTGVALIVVDDRGENQIAVAPGANRAVTPEMVEERGEIIAGADVLLAQLETPVEAFIRAGRIARAHGTKVVLNPAPAAPLPAEAWEVADVLTPNQSELAELTREGSVRELTERGVQVVATLGAEGAVRHGPDGSVSFPARPAEAVDATGAGDAFNAGLAVGLAEAGLEAGVELGLRAGAYAVTSRGALDGLASRAQLDGAFPPRPTAGTGTE